MSHQESRKSWKLFGALVVIVTFSLAASGARAQQNWNAKVGGQSGDKAMQAVAFLPNELWIHAGDTITWTSASDDTHTVTFLTVGQIYPFDFTQGCPPISANGSSFDGSTCVASPPLTKGQTFTVTFPTPGNYELVCLVHSQMFGMIHVLDPSLPLPHDQAFYDKQAQQEENALFADNDGAESSSSGNQSMGAMLMARVLPQSGAVTTGTGEIAATPGGQQSLSIVRFMPGTITIHAGQTIEWSNWDPATGHTITFGTEPADLFDPSCSPSPCSVNTDADGALHATISSTTQNVHSGAIVALYEDETGVPQFPAFPPTRFRVTFTKPGTYPYKCSFHDNLGMVGKVIVLP